MMLDRKKMATNGRNEHYDGDKLIENRALLSGAK